MLKASRGCLDGTLPNQEKAILTRFRCNASISPRTYFFSFRPLFSTYLDRISEPVDLDANQTSPFDSEHMITDSSI